MTNQDSVPEKASNQRRRAEEVLREKAVKSPSVKAPPLSTEIQRILHELEVHQIELEMQNEELKRAQAALEIERERYFNLFELAPVGYCIINEKGLIERINLAAASMLSISRSNLLKQPFSNYIVNKDYDIYYLHRKKLLETGEPQSCELRMLKEDGTQWWAQIAASLTQNEEDTSACRFVLSDITQRKKTEEARRESEVRFRELFNRTRSGIAVYEAVDNGEDFIFVDFNPAAEKIEKISSKDILGRRVSEVFPGVKGFGIFDVFQRVWRSAQPEYFPQNIYRDDREGGSWRENWVFKLATGELVAMYNDISERMKAEEMLRSSEQNFRTIWETMLQGVVQQGADGKVISMNPAAERILGKSPQDFLGTTSVDQEHETIRDDGSLFPGLEHPSMVALYTGKTSDNVVMGVYNSREKGYRWISISSVPLLRSGETKPYQVYTIFDDITERKKAREELERSYQKEREQRQELEEEAKARGMFVDILAHEIRTPLTPLVVCSAILQETLGSSDAGIQKRLVANICSGTQSLKQRLEELLDMGKLSRGTFTLNKQAVNVTDLVSKAAAQFKPLVEQQSRQLILEVQDGLPVIEADTGRLEQVLSNLLSNAVKYSPKNTPITLKVGNSENHIVIEVQDQGAGISEDEQKKLFSPYHRVQQDTQKYPGIGLGLAICKQIVEAHGGSIGIESHSNINTCFRVEIPVKKQGG